MFGNRDKNNHAENYDKQLARTDPGKAVSKLPARLKGTKPDKNIRVVSLDQVVARKQIREEFDEEALQELASSLKEHGQLQPCTGFFCEADKKFVLVAGERRFRAAQIAELGTLRMNVLDHEPEEAECHEIQLIENVQREDLNPIEEARGYQRFIDDFGWSQRDIATKTGKNQSTVNRALALLKLPPVILDELTESGAPRRLAEALNRLGTIEEQKGLLQRYRDGEVTVHEAQKETSPSKSGGRKKTSTNKQVRVKKFDGIDFKATGKKKHTNTNYALGVLEWCEDLSTDKKSSADREQIATRSCNLIRALGKGADSNLIAVLLEELRNVTSELEQLQRTAPFERAA